MSWLQNLTKKVAPEVQLVKEGDKPLANDNDKYGKRYTDEQQLRIIELIAKGYFGPQIVKKLKEEFELDVPVSTVYYYRNHIKWRTRGRELREKFINNVQEIPGANKAVRLERMEATIEEAVNQGDLKTVIKANDQQRKEFENKNGDVNNLYIDNPVYNTLNMLSNDELIKRHKEATERLKLGVTNDGPVRTAEENKE